MSLEIDLYAFEQDLQRFDRELGDDLLGVGDDLAKQAEADAENVITRLIYSQPLRGNPVYDRTGAARDSIQASVTPTREGVDINLEGTGGAGGREYFAALELGTRQRRRTLDDVLSEARGSSDPLGLPPGERGPGGLESRSSILTALAAAEDALPDAVLEAVSKAWA